uniref:Triadin n=1 Tax=Gallus gallus TaxID=9031 RepID=A0A8V0XPC8_CHICK
MAEVTAEGRMSTITTITDGKNGSVPSSMRMGKKSVTEDLVTTFSSPAAWLLVVALIVTWSAVAIVMFDLVDYKTLAASYSQHCDDPCLPPGRSVNKLSTEPLRIIHETLEESTDWLYGFISLLSDIVWSDDDDSDEGEVESSLIKEIHKEKTERYEKRTTPKVIHREKPQKQERNERKEHLKVTHKDRSEKQEKPEKRERHTVIHREKSEKSEKHEKKAPPKVIQKHKLERHERTEKKPPPKEEKKVKSTKVETKVKKEVKDGKAEAKMAEKVKQTETKTTEVGLIKAKPKFKEEKALQTLTKSEKKDQYAFCRYVIDMFAHGDFYPGHKEMVSPRLLLEHSPRKKPAAIEGKKEEKKMMDVRRTTTETKKKEKEVKKEKAQEKTATPEIKKADKKEAAVTKEPRKPAKAPSASPATKKTAAPEQHKKEKIVETVSICFMFVLTAKTTKKDVKAHASVETLKSKTVHEKKEEKATKAAEQDKPKMKHANPGKEKELKYSAATKDKERDKEKEGKNSTALKDKESLKGKNPKNPEGSKEKGTGKRKDAMPPTVLKEKDSSKGKEMRVPAMTKEKAAVRKQEEKKEKST